MPETAPIFAQKIAGATRVDTSLADKQTAGSTSKQLSTESSALEPAMRNGSDGLGRTSGHRCAIWSENMNHPAIIRYLLQNEVDLTISNSFTL